MFSVDIVFKIAGLGILLAILHIVLDQAGKKEVAWIVSLVGLVVVMMISIQLIGQFFNSVKTIFNLW